MTREPSRRSPISFWPISTKTRRRRDTLEGIVWRLLERRARFYTTRVKEAIAELVAQGLAPERQGPDGQIHYRLNPRRRRQIRARLKQS